VPLPSDPYATDPYVADPYVADPYVADPYYLHISVIIQSHKFIITTL
jgi:hypothetical protein